jgi:hypothetical protein
VEQQELVHQELRGYPFTEDELERLSTYKTAVEAGFYTDGLAEPSTSRFAFIQAELGRLTMYRAAIRAGFYTDYFVDGGEAEARHIA